LQIVCLLDITGSVVKERYPNDDEVVGDIWSPIWDIPAVADSLDAEVSLYNDVLTGPGYRLRLRSQSELQLFPENHIMSLRHPYFVLNMAHVTNIETLKGKVVVESGDISTQAQVVFRANGELIFNVYNRSLQAEHSEQTEEQPEQKPKEEAAPEQKPKEEAAPEPLRQEPSPAEDKLKEGPQEKEKEQVFRFTGRIGKIIETRTGTGKLKIVVPLGVKLGEETAWHRITFWEDRAEQIIKTRKAGELVTVVFYEHPPREVVTKTGVRKLVPDLRGAAMYTPKEKK
jgi:hypothetical protein